MTTDIEQNAAAEKESQKVLDMMLNSPNLNFIIKSNLSAHELISKDRDR